ncbi:MAG: hypothetical protein KDI38_22175 [Calditrichaeota bacterium]|nr:hypothetical protein [Calditrichota bacterium]MCB0306485.1 hypothetical protein [Calditrichota bacterium]
MFVRWRSRCLLLRSDVCSLALTMFAASQRCLFAGAHDVCCFAAMFVHFVHDICSLALTVLAIRKKSYFSLKFFRKAAIMIDVVFM